MISFMIGIVVVMFFFSSRRRHTRCSRDWSSDVCLPSGVPAVLLPLIVVIEIISYLSRPVSLSVRLFANMMAGHTMMKVFGGFVISLGIVGGWLPLSFSVALTGLEILVAFLQAYVFAILTCIYLNDALNLHH
mgnify:CR=1 FL=1